MSFGVRHYRKRPKRRAIRDDEIRRADCPKCREKLIRKKGLTRILFIV